MSFVARLRPELIRVAPPWRTFEETIAGLVALLAGERLLPAAAEGAAIQAVTAREAASSTALLDIHAGVPHARLPGIKQPLAAIATLLRSPELRAGLLGARDAQEALRLLRAHAGTSRPAY